MRSSGVLVFVYLVAAGPVCLAQSPLRVVAAESVYGDVARQVGGDDVAVASILTNPDQDPHLFEVSPSVARVVAAARIVISNGLDYDPWMDRLLASTKAPGRQSIVVAQLAGRKPGDNPHIWYDTDTVLALARRFSALCAEADKAHAANYALGLQRFTEALLPVQARIASLRVRLAGIEVVATEPVFGAMTASLGMVSRDQGFQRSVMNETEASAGDVAALEDDLRSHRTRLLIYNRQATDTVADRMRTIAREAGVPVLGVTETEPSGVSYQAWLSSELDGLERALDPQ